MDQAEEAVVAACAEVLDEDHGELHDEDVA